MTTATQTAQGIGTYRNRQNGCTVRVQHDGHSYIAQLLAPSGLPTAHLCSGPELAPLLAEMKTAALAYTDVTRQEIEETVAVMADAIPHYVGSLTVARFVEDCLTCKPADMSLLDFADHAGSWLICNADAADCDWHGAVASFCRGYRQASSHRAPAKPFRAVLRDVNRAGEELSPAIVREFSSYDRADEWIETAVGQGLGNAGSIHEHVPGIGWVLAD